VAEREEEEEEEAGWRAHGDRLAAAPTPALFLRAARSRRQLKPFGAFADWRGRRPHHTTTLTHALSETTHEEEEEQPSRMEKNF
jgi:hypothetical protein